MFFPYHLFASPLHGTDVWVLNTNGHNGAVLTTGHVNHKKNIA